MKRRLPLSRIDALGLLLAVATLVTWRIGDSGGAGPGVVAFVFALAAGKGCVVILDFMELRQAPALWRGIVLGWLLAVTAAILLFYSIGPT